MTITQKQLDTLQADIHSWFKDAPFIVALTNHFRTRVNDDRNAPPVDIQELTMVFACAANEWQKIAEIPVGGSVIIRDTGGGLFVCCEMVEDEISFTNRLVATTIIRTEKFRYRRKSSYVDI